MVHVFMSSADTNFPACAKGEKAGAARRGFQAALLCLPFVAALFYPGVPPWASSRGLSLSVFCVLIAAVALYTAVFALAFRSDAPEAAPAPLRRWHGWLLGGLVAAVFCGSASRGMEFFPALVDSEAEDALRLSEMALEQAQQGYLGFYLRHHIGSYNLGLVPLVVPVVGFLGPSRLAYKWTNAAFFALMLAGLAVLFARTTARPGTRWTVLLLPLVAAILPSLQMYRWHAVCLAGCLALLSAASAWRQPAGKFLAPLGMFLCLLALYHGQVIYLPALLLLAAWQALVPGEGGVAWGRVAILAGFALATGSAFEVLGRAGVLSNHIQGEAANEAGALAFFGRPDNLHPFFTGVLDMPVRAFGWPLWGLVLLGVAVTVERARVHVADRAALLLFGAGFSLNLGLHSLMNPSRHCWFLLPGLWLLLNGAAGLAGHLREVFSPRLGTALAVGALGLVGWKETGAYLDREMYYWLDSGPQVWNTRHHLDYVFRHLSPLPPIAATLHLVPGPAVPVKQGGFVRAVEDFTGLDWRPRRVPVREFNDERELLCLVRGVREGKVRFSRAVIYLSQIGPDGEPNPEKLVPALAGVPHEESRLELQGAPLPAPAQCFAITVERGR